MTIGFDEIPAATIGTGTTLTTLATLTSPNIANGIIEVIPLQFVEGAYVSNQSVFTRFSLTSDDVDLLPKRFVLPLQHGGDATFSAVGPSATKAMSLNIPLNDQSRVNYLGQSVVAHGTNGPDVGGTVVYTDGGVGQQQFSNTPDTSTVGGTTVDTRTTLNTLTITGASEINQLMGWVGIGASTLSIHGQGFFEYSSSDFLTPMPYRVANSAWLAGLGLNANLLGNGMHQYVIPNGQGVPVSSRTTIDMFYTNEDAVGTGSDVLGGVGFLK